VPGSKVDKVESRRDGIAVAIQSRGARPHTYLEAVDNTNTYVVIVLPASPGINVQSWSSGVEVARFDPRAPSVPWIHIQSRSELDDTGVGATWSGVP